MSTRIIHANLVLGCLFVFLAGCVKVEIKDERPYPTYFEIVLVTHTPQQRASVEEAVTPPPTSTQPLPTETFTPFPSLTPTITLLPTETSTPAPLTGILNQNAFCRQGPDILYTGRLFLSAGEQVTILGRNPQGTWWLVQSAISLQPCWTAAISINLSGEPGSVEIATAPPAPAQPPSPDASATPTRRPRQNPPTVTPGGPPVPTNTPNPYPYP